MKNTAISMVFVAALSACTARMEVQNGLTERGFAAVRDYEMGQVMHWLPEENQLLPVATIDKPTRSFGAVESLRVNFETGVEFAGGVALTAEEEALLESEVASRTTTLLTNAVTRSMENVVTTVIDDWNARPEIWLNELGIADRGWPEDGAPLYVALIYKQTLADKLDVQVDRASAGDAEFSSSITNSGGNLKFKIVDAASLAIEGEATPVFYDFAIIRIRNSAEGPRFSQVRNADVRQQLANYIVN